VTTLMAAVALTAGFVADASGGRLVAGGRDRTFDAVSIDSRTLAPGSLFIALRGDRFDGHAFVDAALQRGAMGLLVSSRPTVGTGDAAVIVVPDTLHALQAIGHQMRRQSGAQVVAITGSTGKTTTKEATAAFLAAKYDVYRNRGNLNNHIGLPLSLIDLRRGPDVAVVELGMNAPGEIRTLVAIAEPDVRVWTNVGDAHYGFFGSRDAIARAKAEILESAGPATVLVANGDDPLIREHLPAFHGRRVLFGERADADVRATRIVDRGIDGTRVDVDARAGRLQLDLPLPGRGQVWNVLAATAVALEFAVPAPSIEARARELRPIERRGSVSMLANGARLVDDSYNASPAAVQMMLAALAATPTTGRRIAVLGEMLELGEWSWSLHEACGRAAAAAGVDALVVIGGEPAGGAAAGARQAGLPASAIHRFADSPAAAPHVAALVQPGDLVLVKGSRGTRTDIVADRLREVA
jgi:UDP-N-acetylmuramoyl-tripeptide--D-alanyl-D-alanine ligase